ncbi:D-xylulose kinase [Sphaerochaeta pleomorpha str. Grapes]|uniref:Xylulose kinase n=1 Tax=Sphaerochaeta pleomorpha (strain ATCC BAA-1885 / DSM 22778 / Grapes) TaxID=158190 RepID=G8QS57_SPHPG|nr:xylulokinase [Sphaerochaeta pleomorpha]AEV28918.1 D-xylulose kinase [Sphaerochaeta pleomorpha str. Grapes]
MQIVAGIDTGTQSTKVLCYDVQKKDVVLVTSAPHNLDSRDDGSREQEASWYIEAIKSCFAQIPAEIKKHIVALGVSGQQHGFVPLDKDGQVLAPVKLWCDTSTSRQCDTLTRRLGGEDAVFALLGNQILPGYTASKVLSLKENNSVAYAKLAHILLPHDYINFYLTGNYTMEAGDASGTAMLDVRTKQWSKEVLAAIDDERDLLGMLPSLIKEGSSCGTVQGKVAAELGLGLDVVVSTGGGDNMMGAIGTGCVQGGTLTMSMGTSGTLFGYSDSCVADRQGRLAAFCSSSGGYLPLLCTMNCTITTEQVRSLFGYDVKQLDALAGQAPIGCNGVTMLPYFNGERVPNFPHGKGVLAGFDLTNMKPENIARAALESSVYAMKGGLDAFRELGFVPKRLILTGGGAKSPIWRRITCDVMQLPVDVPQVTESAAFGAALQALWTLQGGSLADLIAEHVKFDDSKRCEVDVSVKEAYEHAYGRYQTYVESMRAIFS